MIIENTASPTEESALLTVLLLPPELDGVDPEVEFTLELVTV